MKTDPASEIHASFFVAGGTVPPDSPSYVERSADRELLEALLAGEFCYVLNSRQMGKSSLAVRAIAQLNDQRVRTAFVDLTRIGGATVTSEQWYAGLLLETGRALGLRTEAAAWLKEQRDMGGAQRLLSFLQELVLARFEGSVVLMIDEIDAVRSLPFSTDELFAGLRQLHNGRASDPTLRRLTLCLLGAALPSDLIHDPRTTPFNVGQRVELRDFTSEEARPFAAQVGDGALRRVLHWTGGHPFLTQTLCADLVGGGDADALVRSRYLETRASETDTNLADVGRRLLGEGDPNVGDKERADTLALYERMLKGKPVADDESNPSAARIKMSGVAQVENGRLQARNRIYRKAFGKSWVRENTPGQELRRQKRAFWKGAIRTGAIAMIVVAAIGGLAWKAARLAGAEKAARERADSEAYAASMSLMPVLWQAGAFERMDDVLKATEHSPDRGWEWGYWHRQNDPGGVWTDGMAGAAQPEISPNGKLVAARIDDTIEIFDVGTLRLVDQIHLTDRSPVVRWVDDDHLLTVAFDSTHLKLVDRRTKRVVRDFGRFFIGVSRPAPDHWTMAGWFEDDLKPYALDLRTGARRSLRPGDLSPNGIIPVTFSPDGRYCAIRTQRMGGKGVMTGVALFETRGWSELKRVVFPNRLNTMALSPDGGRLAVGTDKDVTLWDWRMGKSSPSHTELAGEALDLRFSSDGRYLVACGIQRRAVLYRVLPLELLPAKTALRGVQYASFVPGTHVLLAGYDRNRLIDVDSTSAFEVTHVGAWPHLWRREEDGLRVQSNDKIVDVDLSGAPAIRTHPLSKERLGDAEGLTIDMSDPKRPRLRSRDGGPTFTIPGAGITGRSWSFPARDRCLVEQGVGKLRVVDLRTGTMGRTIDVGRNVDDLDFSRDGVRIAVGFVDGTVGLYDAVSGTPLWTGSFHHAWPTDQIRFSPDERTLLTAGQDQTATVIDAASGRLRFRLKGHIEAVDSIDESPDGHRIVTGSDDRTVRIWDATTGRELTSISFEAPVVSIRFSRDGRRLFVQLSSGDLHVLFSGDARENVG